MEITIEWRDGKYPSFNLNLHSKEGADAFMSIKGCRLADGKKGKFVSYPSRKQDDGKYWNHVWGSEKFNDVVLKKALEGQPKKENKTGFDDLKDEAPF